jgi:MoxR-like ATPase
MAASPPLDSLPERLAAHLRALEQGLIERGVAVRLLLLAALAGEHALLIGPPGTAKSLLARRLSRVFDGARFFERLLTRFSTPEELFGPLSLKALEDDRYERLIDGYLPTAGIGFLDEVFKANSAILNALLTLLNEREFDNGAGRRHTPLICVVGASNELPTDESLLAFHDRFLLRVPVQPVGDANFAALLQLDESAAPAVPPLTAAERAAITAARDRVGLGDDALAALRALRGWLTRHEITVSDRRWRQLVGLMRCAAACEGRDTLDAIDLWLAAYVVAPDVDAVAALLDWFAHELLGAVPQSLTWLTRAVEAFEQQLQVEQQLPADEGDDGAGKMALARALGAREAEGGPMRIVAAALEERLRRRFSPVHVAARLAQVDELVGRVAQARQTVQAERDALQVRLAGRLWLPPEFAQRWLGAHDQTLQRLDELAARLAAGRAGFAALPVDDELPAITPPLPTLAAEPAGATA